MISSFTRRADRAITMHMPHPERTAHNDTRFDRALLAIWTSLSRPVSSAMLRLHLSGFVREVESLEGQVAALSGDALRSAADELRRNFGKDRNAATARAFALAREATRRQLGLRHFPVQLLGGAVMMRGALAEMQTGEGKTLTAVLPAVAAALGGRNVHVVTVNDYLARRDAADLAPIYRSLGISMGVIQQGMPAPVRQRAYACDVAYCTNKELVFDYLRDRQALGTRRSRAHHRVDRMLCRRDRPAREQMVLSGLRFAIVDEADSVLIDEARTPLILSGADTDAGGDADVYPVALDVAAKLVAGQDFELSHSDKAAKLLPEGLRKAERSVSGRDGIWTVRRAREELVRQALCALHFFHRDVQYIVAGGEVQIVDEFTGRVMPGRSWEHGMHQLIEAKEGCAVTARKIAVDKITYQQFFRKFQHLCGMTGTATEVAGELRAVYDLAVVPIATNRPCQRVGKRARFFACANDKWEAVAEAASEHACSGRAVLIGTRSVEASEEISARLGERDLAHVVLNARQDSQEAEIVAGAGRKGRITVATNMAGRGTDIRPEDEVLQRGGLHVILTEFHESRRIDRQLFGRAARQGDPGSFEAVVSLDDELFRRFCPVKIATLRRAGRASIVGSLLTRLSQAAAERIHRRARRAALSDALKFSELLGFAGKE